MLPSSLPITDSSATSSPQPASPTRRDVLFVADLIPSLLVSHLLLLNQPSDAEPDREAGRRHYPVVIGRRASSIVCASLLFLA